MSEPPETAAAPAPETPRPSVPAGARCAVHPEAEARALCVRCGNFMCGECSSQGTRELCAACMHRKGGGAFPFTRDRYTFDGLLTYALETFKRQWLPLCLASLIVFAASFMVGMFLGLLAPLSVLVTGEDAPFLALGLQGFAQIAQSVVQLWLMLGMLEMMLCALEGREAQLPQLFTQAPKLLPALALALLASTPLLLYAGIVGGVAALAAGQGESAILLVVGAGVLLGILPSMAMMAWFWFALTHLVHAPRGGPIASIVAAYRITRGKRWTVLAFAAMAFIIYMAGLALLCVGVLASAPLAGLLWCSLYLALSRRDGDSTASNASSSGPTDSSETGTPISASMRST